MSTNEEFDQNGSGIDIKDSGTYSSDISSSLEVLGNDLGGIEDTSPADMAAASKELNSAESERVKEVKASGSADDGIFSLIYTVIKKVAVVGTVYILGYMGLSFAWLIAPIAFLVARDQLKKASDKKFAIAKASALTNEREVILPRLHEWVHLPDVECCKWVNKILEQVWPNVNRYACTFIEDVIEPNVAEAFENYEMDLFQFGFISLGTIPPRIGNVKIYDKNFGSNEIIMDLDLFYEGDCDINIFFGEMRGGIKDFKIEGRIRVVMKPLIFKMPLVGALEISFLKNPDIDFNLVGLLDMPGLSDILHRVIVEQIAAIMVLPNKLPITLSDEVPACTLNMPKGVIRILTDALIENIALALLKLH